MLEVIVTSVEDAIAAEVAGADRLELCVALSEDGLTPSLGLIETVVSAVNIPVHVMIRPHNRGFSYSDKEIAAMQKDILYSKSAGAKGIVFGVLTKELTIDEVALGLLLKEARGLQVTFHRAFDAVVNQEEALAVLLKYPQVTRVLTSGGQAKVTEAISQLQKLVELTKRTHITILAGSGLIATNLVHILKETGVQEVHVGSGIRHASSYQEAIDGELIRKIKQNI